MKCEYCNNKHNGEYGSGRFCNSKCARGFSTRNKRKEINEIISSKLYGRIISPKIERECIICNIKFYTRWYSKIKTCNNKICKNLYKKKYVGPKLSKALKGKTGGYRIGSGRSIGSYYKEQYFDSSFEIDVAKFLDENNIKWKRNTKRFYYIFNNKKTYYIPDFIIKDEIFLETKGYWFGDKKQKTIEAVKQNNINWILLMQKEEWNKDKNILLKKIKMACRTI